MYWTCTYISTVRDHSRASLTQSQSGAENGSLFLITVCLLWCWFVRVQFTGWWRPSRTPRLWGTIPGLGGNSCETLPDFLLCTLKKCVSKDSCGVIPCLCYNKFSKITLLLLLLSLAVVEHSKLSAKRTGNSPLNFKINYMCKKPFKWPQDS